MLKNIAILTTGGTIAGIGNNDNVSGYKSGKANISKILDFNICANVEFFEICNVNSDDINFKILFELAKKIDALANKFDGFVITHGTDTMSETAYFLSLTLNTKKAVILTGAMRPITAIGYDGKANLRNAIQVATCDKATGTLVVFGGKIFDARMVQKCNANALQPFGVDAPDTCAIGFVQDSFIKLTPILNAQKPILNVTDFETTTMPKVNIIYFNICANADLLNYAINNSNGIVIAGAGSGEFSLEFKTIIEKATIPVVVSTRIGHGFVTKNNLIAKNTIAAFDLPPQKCAILLKLALIKKLSISEIQHLFEVY